MFPFTKRNAIKKQVVEHNSQYGFTWVSVDNKHRICTPDQRFKQVPRVVINELREKSQKMTIDEVISEIAEQNSGAASILREMYEEGFIREGEPIEQIQPPPDIRIWPRILIIVLLLALASVFWVDALSIVAQPIRKKPFQYLLDTIPLAIPLIFCSIAVHECGHYYTAWKQGLDPSFGVSVINGVVPAVVTRTHGGWSLPRNRRMWNTLTGPTYGLIWTLGVFILYHIGLSYPALALAGIVCFNSQVAALIPLYHGDGYLLMTDFFGQQNLRTQGLEDLRNRCITWPATYAALSYGLVIIDFVISLIIGYMLGDFWGAGITLTITVAIYAESWLGLVDRSRTVFSLFYS